MQHKSQATWLEENDGNWDVLVEILIFKVVVMTGMMMFVMVMNLSTIIMRQLRVNATMS